jgi:hypothetical protein
MPKRLKLNLKSFPLIRMNLKIKNNKKKSNKKIRDNKKYNKKPATKHKLTRGKSLTSTAFNSRSLSIHKKPHSNNKKTLHTNGNALS